MALEVYGFLIFDFFFLIFNFFSVPFSYFFFTLVRPSNCFLSFPFLIIIILPGLCNDELNVGEWKEIITSE